MNAKTIMAAVMRSKEGNHDAVESIVRRLVGTLNAMMQRQDGPNNYQAQSWDKRAEVWINIGPQNTKDYCTGFAEARGRYGDHTCHVRVVCGGSVVWPKKWWLADAALSLEELNR